MAAIRLPLDRSAIPRPFMSLQAAAVALDRSVGHVRRLCGQRWQPEGLAHKHCGEWIVHPAADPRLDDQRGCSGRDLEQLGQLRLDGVKAEHLEIAQRRRNILRRFEAFDEHCHIATAFQRFVDLLRSEGLIPCPGIQRVSLTTLYRWRRHYRQHGLRGLVPQFGKRGRKRHEIGKDAWAFFHHLILGGNSIGVAQAHTLTLGEIERHHRGEAGWEWPSKAVIENAARRRISRSARTLANKGLRAFDAVYIPKACRDVESIASCEEWDGDERTLDVMVRVLTSRGWQPRRNVIITAWRDMRS